VEFYVTKSIPQDFAAAKSCFNLSSKHSSIFITLIVATLNQENEPILSNRHTNWDNFRHLASERLTLNILLKIDKDIEAAVKFFSDTIQCTG
jgi:hypothetical protein